MARISSFSSALIERSDEEPVSIGLFRKMARSEEIRLLLGDFFLRLAANEPADRETPHQDLLRRMLGAREMACNEQLSILAKNLDLLRNYDLGSEARRNFPGMARKTSPGQELVEQGRACRREFGDKTDKHGRKAAEKK